MKLLVLALLLAGVMEEVQAAAVPDETMNDALADHEDIAENAYADHEHEHDEAREEFDSIDVNGDGFIDRGEIQAVDNHVGTHQPRPDPNPTLACAPAGPARGAIPHGLSSPRPHPHTQAVEPEEVQEFFETCSRRVQTMDRLWAVGWPWVACDARLRPGCGSPDGCRPARA